MALERTLSIVKPDGVARNLIGDVYRRFEAAGLTIIAARMLRLSQAEAEAFYAVHRERPFYRDLVRYMTSGPVMVQVLKDQVKLFVDGVAEAALIDAEALRKQLATATGAEAAWLQIQLAVAERRGDRI